MSSLCLFKILMFIFQIVWTQIHIIRLIRFAQIAMDVLTNFIIRHARRCERETHSFTGKVVLARRSSTNPDRVPSPSDRVTKEFVVINSSSLPAALPCRGVASPTYPIDVFENRHWRKTSEWRSRDEHSRRLLLHERAWYSTGYFLASECQGKRQRGSKKIYAGTPPRPRE